MAKTCHSSKIGHIIKTEINVALDSNIQILVSIPYMTDHDYFTLEAKLFVAWIDHCWLQNPEKQ
jgi:hypothetical protein